MKTCARVSLVLIVAATAVAGGSPVHAQRLRDQPNVQARWTPAPAASRPAAYRADSTARRETYASEGGTIGAVFLGLVGAYGGHTFCTSWGDAPCTAPLVPTIAGAAVGALVGYGIGYFVGGGYFK